MKNPPSQMARNAILKDALRHRQAGRDADAASLYRQLLQADPGDPDAHLGLGTLALQTGRPDAISHLQHALQTRPNHPEALYLLGRAYQQAGALPAAEQAFRNLVRAAPALAAGHTGLGGVLWATGRLPEAAECYERAVTAAPNDADIQCSAAAVMLGLKRWEKAGQYAKRAIKLAPKMPAAHGNRAFAAMNQSQWGIAIKSLKKLAQLTPDDPRVPMNLGQSLYRSGRLSDALTVYEDALQRLPEQEVEIRIQLATVLNQMKCPADALAQTDAVLEKPDIPVAAYLQAAVALEATEQYEDALTLWQKCVEIAPEQIDGYIGLSAAHLRKGNIVETEEICRKALEQDPNNAPIYNNLGMVLDTQGRLKEALVAFESAISLAPDMARTYYNIAHLMGKLRRFETALKYAKTAAEQLPKHVGSRLFIGDILSRLHRYDEADQAFVDVLSIDPDHLEAMTRLYYLRHRVCQWQGRDVLLEEIIDVSDRKPKLAAPPLLMLSADLPASWHLRNARRTIEYDTRFSLSPGEENEFKPLKGKRDRLTVGYLCGDFRQHPVAFLVAELFECHDREKFHIIAYSHCPDDGSDIRCRIAAGVDQFVNIEQTEYRAAARRIHEDGVDILVDLSGPTEHSRLNVIARRPAPIQVNYLGFSSTTGAPCIDYLIGDPFVTPSSSQELYSEALVQLPDSYMVNDRKRAISDTVPTREACGLPTESIVFCAFNDTYKITPPIFDVWMHLLTELPGSVLWLRKINDTATDALRRQAEKRGVAPERLVFAPRVDTLADHLARQRLADLYLDTTPYNAHASCSDALWAGLPVVTCAGEGFASRVAGSLLTAVGLPELIAHSLDEYRDKALALARDHERRAAIRQKLMDHPERLPLFDTPRVTRHLEAAYRAMWDRYEQGLEPAPISIPPAS